MNNVKRLRTQVRVVLLSLVILFLCCSCWKPQENEGYERAKVGETFVWKKGDTCYIADSNIRVRYYYMGVCK